MKQKLSDYRLRLGESEYYPLMQGGMGVDISTADLALSIARLGGVGHISDAMSPFLSDQKFGTRYQSTKGRDNKAFRGASEKPGLKWDVDIVKQSAKDYVLNTMGQKYGPGGVFINIMEKLTMGSPKDTLKARLEGALDGGIDGITLSAGLHKGSLPLMADHPRFRDCKIGIIVSSARALNIFLRSAKKVDRMPDYVVVEGPLAGGHLGYGEDWKKHSLEESVKEVIEFLASKDLEIPVIPAGGIFDGDDAVRFIEGGASAVQVATRFTISQECGLPENVKQEYLKSKEDDVDVNFTSPTGYAMRMLKSSPSMKSNIKPNCESLGYLLDGEGKCAYIQAYEAAPVNEKGRKLPVTDKMCICTHFMNYDCYTCGHNVFRLKDTTRVLANGKFYLPPAEDIFNDYVFNTGPSQSKKKSGVQMLSTLAD